MTAPDDPDLLPAYPRALGVELGDCTPERVTGSLLVTADHGNRNGVMHGGAIMAFADSLGGVASALLMTGDDKTTTLESKTNFLRPVAIGERITARCEPIHSGRKTQVWKTTVLRQDGKPAAVTIQTQMTLSWQGPA